jgi:putative aldouronate transport system permease protein
MKMDQIYRTNIRIKTNRNSHIVWKQIKKNWQLYVLLVIPIIFVLVFRYYPMYGAQIAFKDFIASKGIAGSEWVGMKHFIRFFKSYEFEKLIKNTLIISVYSLLAGIPFPIILALSLNYVRNRLFKKSVQMITYAPHFISVVVMAGIVLELLDPINGIVNKLLGILDIGPINFMGKPDYFSSIYVWSGIWQNVGFSCIIYLAALAGVDPAQHEAAVIDGANKFQRMIHVDLPSIIPVMIILLILNTGHIMDLGFEKVLLLQNPLNLRTSEIIDTYVYKVGLASQAMNYSYSTAINLFKSVIGLILLISVNQLAKKAKQESLW